MFAALSSICIGSGLTLAAPDTALPLLRHVGVTAALVALPFLVIAGTSFLKISIVLAILRSAFGTQGVPPSAVLTALAAVLSMFVMAPVGTQMFDAAQSFELSSNRDSNDPIGLEDAQALYRAASPPLLKFLRQNTPAAETSFFLDLAGLPPTSEQGLRILLPAFATAELVEAFLIGILVYLPFLVIDLIVSVSLLSLGMHMLSPITISLPLKLLLFVAVDGWHILLSGILFNYAT